jgi:hypothetical protein
MDEKLPLEQEVLLDLLLHPEKYVKSITFCYSVQAIRGEQGKCHQHSN